MLMACFGALAIGATLGLIGSGGSILTLPVLLFMFQRPDKLAIAESLAIVGGIACVGSAPYALRGQVDWKSVVHFGLTGIAGAYLGAVASRHVSGSFQLMLFALVLFVAAWMMLFGPRQLDEVATESRSTGIVMMNGLLVGFLTGLLGVGGGFLIVPALVFFCGLSMRFAVGTSLVIIAMNSFTGFIGQWRELSLLQLYVDWGVIALVATIGILGSLGGYFLGSKMHPKQLRQVFAIVVFLIGITILMRDF